MKKILLWLGVTILASAPINLVLACSIGSLDGRDYLNSLPNFDWSNPEYGDGLDFNNSNNQNILNNTGKPINLGSVNPTNTGHYLDYSKFNTGFQWIQNIKKQAVTGVPLNQGFMPNGNYASDFGITSSARRYLRMNSILDWNPNQNYDAKYNQATIPLQMREPVATANSINQDERINYNQLGFSTRKHRTFDNTIVGTKNPFENTMLNWQYTNDFINWSGSWFEGPIVPPPADMIDSAHINGTPILGNIFLDGYHGLTREMLKDFLAQDKNGTYKIVNILINIAKYNGFDGWFINNESNGAAPNGTVLDYNTLYDIIKAFNQQVATSNDQTIKKLKLIYYRNDATLSKNSQGGYDDLETLKMTQSGYQKPNGTITPTDIQLNFGEIPDKTTAFLSENPNYSGQNLNTMLNAEASPNFFGTYDFRQLTYPEIFTNLKPSYNKNNYTGFSEYLDSGAGAFGSYAYDWAKNNHVDNTRAYLFAAQTTNLFNTIQFSGTNTFISKNDTGMQSNRFSNDYTGLNPSGGFQQAAFISDPRIKTTQNKGSEDSFVKANIYNYQANNGYNSSSYGIGDLVKEKTTLFDDQQILNKTTNFSMGSGIKFVNRDQDGNAIVANDYPWTNRRLTDILPTYQWKIYDNAQPNQPLDISKISGFYDYDTVYQKGNSIALGSGFNEEGTIEKAFWDKNKVYDWDIMGTNLTSNHHSISFIYNDNASKSDINFLVTTTNQKLLTSKQEVCAPSTTQNLKDGWVKISLDLDNISVDTNNRISKLGLQIKPKKDNFKFNVGEFKINSSDNNNVNNFDNTTITKAMSEYLINRNQNNQTLFNARLQWNATNTQNLSYYAVYYYDDNKWYRVGETTQNCYFLKNLKSTNNSIKLMIKPVFKDGIISQAEFTFNIEI